MAAFRPLHFLHLQCPAMIRIGTITLRNPKAERITTPDPSAIYICGSVTQNSFSLTMFFSGG